MSSLSSTAEEILELFDQGRAHPDHRVDRVILKTDIENIINQHIRFHRFGNIDNDFALRTMFLTNRS